MIKTEIYPKKFKGETSILDSFFTSKGDPVLFLFVPNESKVYYKEIQDVEDLDKNSKNHLEELLKHIPNCKKLIGDCAIAYIPRVQYFCQTKGITLFTKEQPASKAQESEYVAKKLYEKLQTNN